MPLRVGHVAPFAYGFPPQMSIQWMLCCDRDGCSDAHVPMPREARRSWTPSETFLYPIRLWRRPPGACACFWKGFLNFLQGTGDGYQYLICRVPTAVRYRRLVRRAAGFARSRAPLRYLNVAPALRCAFSRVDCVLKSRPRSLPRGGAALSHCQHGARQ